MASMRRGAVRVQQGISRASRGSSHVSTAIASEISTRNGPAKDNLQVNEYWYHEHFDGKAKSFLKEVISAMNDGNHDNSDIQTDYFDVGWYTHINVGRWNKPYLLTK